MCYLICTFTNRDGMAPSEQTLLEKKDDSCNAIISKSEVLISIEFTIEYLSNSAWRNKFISVVVIGIILISSKIHN